MLLVDLLITSVEHKMLGHKMLMDSCCRPEERRGLLGSCCKRLPLVRRLMSMKRLEQHEHKFRNRMTWRHKLEQIAHIGRLERRMIHNRKTWQHRLELIERRLELLERKLLVRHERRLVLGRISQLELAQRRS